MSFSSKTLLLCGGYDFSVPDQTGGAVVVVTRKVWYVNTKVI